MTWVVSPSSMICYQPNHQKGNGSIWERSGIPSIRCICSLLPAQGYINRDNHQPCSCKVVIWWYPLPPLWASLPFYQHNFRKFAVCDRNRSDQSSTQGLAGPGFHIGSRRRKQTWVQNTPCWVECLQRWLQCQYDARCARAWQRPHHHSGSVTAYTCCRRLCLQQNKTEYQHWNTHAKSSLS